MNLIDASKRDWLLRDKNQIADVGELQSGCLQRIANACEVMAKNYNQLMGERASYERSYRISEQENKRLSHVIAGLRGHIGRLRRIKP